MILRPTVLLAATLLVPTVTPAQNQTLTVQGDHFALNGKPFQIISGEMHYARVPRAYWRQRLRMARAMGLNTITTYVFWNIHEPTPGHYDFSGQNDVAEFIREAGQEGLHVILRPGPYACAEWEWGGYPAWLLKTPGIVVRSRDPRFLQPASTWLHRLGQELAPLQSANGGPIIAVQVENEYGSFGSDHAYMEDIHHILLDSGFNKALLYTADGPAQIPNGSLPELPAVINFGGGDAKSSFAKLHELRPAGPFMAGEYWAGWFDHYGDPYHQVTDPAREASEIQWMLDQKYSISIYMFHGGTSFGWMNGANSNGSDYQPDTTSYDYDAPLSESGHITPKYLLIRAAIQKATGIVPPPIPGAPPAQTLAPIPLPLTASLWQNLPIPVHSQKLLTMEDLGQAYGYILYRTTIPAGAPAAPTSLVLDGLHDYAQIYADGTLLGTLDRRDNQTTLPVQLHPGQRLDLLIENSSRVNYSKALLGERKGILNAVTLGGTPLSNWQIFSLPMQPATLDALHWSDAPCTGPCFFRGSFTPPPASGFQPDTFLTTSPIAKGFVWVDSTPLGRAWADGPQRALYLPGPFLQPGPNTLTVFDLAATGPITLTTRSTPDLGPTKK